MAARKEDSYRSEWEYEQDNEEFEVNCDEVGEEAGRDLVKNAKAWNQCDKPKTDAKYHQRYIPVNDALRFKHLSKEEKDDFIEEKALTHEDRMFLSSDKGARWLEILSNAVVCITVKLISGQAYGTGVFVRVDDEDVVITNTHSVRNGGNGVDFRLVNSQSVRVISFYNGDKNSQVTHKVARINRASLPEKNKANDVLKKTLEGQLRGETKESADSNETADVAKCNVALNLLSPYLKRRDAFLDYVLLYLQPLKDEKEQAKFSKMKPIAMKAFDKLEHFRNVSSFEIPDPKSSRYPRALRLFTLSHPHRASMQLSFGEMLSNLQHVYFLQMAYGQNDTGMLSGKDPFAEHSIATCRGSSGAPIFAYIFNHETREIVFEECVYFLHFFGDVHDGKFRGKSVAFSTILRNLENQKLHEELGSAFSEVGNQVDGEKH